MYYMHARIFCFGVLKLLEWYQIHSVTKKCTCSLKGINQRVSTDYSCCYHCIADTVPASAAVNVHTIKLHYHTILIKDSNPHYTAFVCFFSQSHHCRTHSLSQKTFYDVNFRSL